MKKLLVIFAAIALIGAFAIPAAAGDWSFYGSSRMATFMEDYDKDAGDDSDVGWAQQGNSRIGANVKGGDITGKFEYGTGVNLRVLWAEWNYGGGTLCLGQNYVPVNLWTSAQAFGGDAGLLDIGGLYGGRQQMIMLKIADLKVALINPSTTAPTIAGGDVDTTLPKVELSWRKSFGMGSIQIVGGYNSIDVETAAKTYGVDSMVIGVLGTANFGAAYVNANVFTATNYTNYGLASWYNSGTPGSAVLSGTEIKDADSLGFLVVGGFKASETMNLELGVGSVEHEPDGAKQGDDTLAYYVQASIALADGFFIVPEIGGYDFGEDSTGAKEGGMTYFGAKWQMNF